MRVLVVDDEPEIYRMLRVPLTSWGYEVKTAEGGDEALNYVRAGHIVDVVITDLTMPGMMGTELLQQVKAFDPDIEVIVMTGFGSIPSAVDAMRLGAHNYITSPPGPGVSYHPGPEAGVPAGLGRLEGDDPALEVAVYNALANLLEDERQTGGVGGIEVAGSRGAVHAPELAPDAGRVFEGADPGFLPCFHRVTLLPPCENSP